MALKRYPFKNLEGKCVPLFLLPFEGGGKSLPVCMISEKGRFFTKGALTSLFGRIFRGFLFFCFFLGGGVPGWCSEDLLTPREREYLQALPAITVCPDPDWAPYEYLDEKGNFAGIAADLLDLLAQRLGIEFTHVIPRDWDEALDLSRSGEVLILPFLNRTPQREKWLIFTEPLLVDPTVFITRQEHSSIVDATQLTDERMILLSGTSMDERVRRDFPNLQVVTVPREEEVLRGIEEGKADLTLRSLTMAAYTIRKEGYCNLKIAGQAPEGYVNRLRMGILKEEPQLRDILNKGIATITPGERKEIVNRHVKITTVTPVNYARIFGIGGVLGIFLFLSFYWNLRLRRSNSALEESERSKSVLIANIPGVAYRCRYDASWTMEFISQGCLDLTGYAPEDLIENKTIAFSDLILGEDVENVWRVWEKAIATKTAATVEYRIRAAGGAEKWVFEQGVPLYDASGEVSFLEGLIIDITDRKRVEAALKRSNTLYEELARQSRTVTWEIDRQGRYTYVSPVAELVLGYAAQEMVEGMFFYDLSLPEEREKVKEYGLGCMERRTEVLGGERRCFTKEGSLIWMAVDGLPLENARGELLGFRGSYRDITWRKGLEEDIERKNALRELVAQISADFVNASRSNVDNKIDSMLERVGLFLGVDRTFLLQFSPDAMCMWNTHEWCASGVVSVKDRMQNYPLQEVPLLAKIIRQRETLFVPSVEELPPEWEAEKRELQQQEVQSTLALPLAKGEALLGYFGFDSVRIQRDLDAEVLEILRILGNILAEALERDFLEKQILAARDAAQRMALAKGEFLANMSHEIRTPMNGIQGMLELLLESHLLEEQRFYVETARASANSLLTILNDILDFSKIEAGKLDLEIRGCSLLDILDDLGGMLGIKAREKGLELLLRMDSQVPLHLQADSHRLRQVLLNLASNAIKFTEKGEVAVSVMRVPEKEKPRRMALRFTIRDTGIGISREQQQLLFHKFSQVHRSASRAYGGTGLGLAISRELVELMEGEIGVTSQEGVGSEFFFEIPLEKPEEEHGLSSLGAPVLEGVRILVASENPHGREILMECLASWGMRPSGAASLEDLQKLFRHALEEGDSFGMVLRDALLPGEAGYPETLEEALGWPKVFDGAVVMLAHRGGVQFLPPGAFLLGKPLRYRELAGLLASLGERSFSKREDTPLQKGSPTFGKSPGPSKESSPGAPSFRGRTILLAEDNSINQKVVTRMLEKTGARVVLAENGEEAVQIAEEMVLDLVLMDLHMPRMDGFEAAGILRKKYPNLPIIALSAAVMEEDRRRTMEAGMQEHLGKPITREILYGTLVRYLPPGEMGVFQESSFSWPKELPKELPGFDLSRGLLLFGGSGEEYRSALEQFFQEIPLQYQPVVQLLKEERMEESTRLLHTLKGVAGALGAKRIREAVEALEQSFQASGGASQEMRRDLEEALYEAREARKALPPLGKRETLSEEEVRGAVEILRKKLKANEFVEEHILHKAGGALHSRGAEAALSRLEDLIHSFEMDKALELLESLFPEGKEGRA
jgi:PAS domain S-box-containing protein